MARFRALASFTAHRVAYRPARRDAHFTALALELGPRRPRDRRRRGPSPASCRSRGGELTDQPVDLERPKAWIRRPIPTLGSCAWSMLSPIATATAATAVGV